MLGPLAASVDGDSVNLGGPKQRLVLALLLVARGEVISVDRLIEGVWGEGQPDGAKHTLQAYISELRQVLDDPIEWTGHGYQMSLKPDQLDASLFETLVGKARETMADAPGQAAELLREALGLWRGRPLEDLDSLALDLEVSRLEELRLVALEQRIEADLKLGRHIEVLGELESLTSEFPLREKFWSHLMLALYRAGRQADALRTFSRLRRTLAEELGIDPSPELQRLEDRILAQDPKLDLVIEGQLTFLFTDLEGSTALWEAFPKDMAQAIAVHDRVVTEAINTAGGSVVKTIGDGVIASLPGVDAAVEAVTAIRGGLGGQRFGAVGELKMRTAIDIGPAQQRDGDYFGPALNRCARLLGLAHGGQVLLSTSAAQALSVDEETKVVDLGECRLKGVGRPHRVFQLVAPALPTDFPLLRTDGTTPLLTRVGFETTSIRGYELRERIGEGDFGEVYRAYQTSVGREVAIKVIRPQYANEASFVGRFEAEAQFVAQLEHPHIVPLYDYWRDPDGAYLVMPYLRGGSLAGTLRRGPWNTGPALHLLEQVAAALSYAHRKGVVHRDVKPSNVLLDEEGNALLTDFGIAVRHSDEAGQPLASTPVYVPPEDLRGERPSPTSDIFCLGVLGFELLTGTQPSERGTISKLAEIRPDLPPELVDVLTKATNDTPSSRYERVEDLLRALRRALGVDVVGATPVEDKASRPPGPVRNPYKGLRAFLETDAADFHGRDALKDELLQALRRHRLVAVVGPSGSGKSSVVRAGLIPALRAGALPGSRSWLITDMFPGSYPFEELEAALRRVAVEDSGSLAEELRSDDRGLLRTIKRILPGDDTELVLVVDQFEELFSMVEDEETRHQFLNGLTNLVTDERSRVRVVVTLRADFFDRPLEYPAFGGLLREGLVAVTPLDDEALALAISRPARGVGLDLEPGLVRDITADVGAEPGALPLLQYALTEMFSRRKGLILTVEGYRSSGGVAGALAARADEVYDGLSEMGKEAAHQIFMRLVSVDEETDDTRRRVRQSELRGLGIDLTLVDTVLQQYAAHRLLTFDRDTLTRSPTVEVAHEALIRQWGRLRGWVDRQRESLVLHRRFTAALNEWEESGRHDNFLLSGGRLAQYETWAEETALVLTANEREFLARGREIEDRRRRRRNLWRGAAVAALVLFAAGAFWQWRVAEAEARQEEVRRLAASSTFALEEDSEGAILLALEAAYVSRRAGEQVRPEAIAAIHQAVQTSRLEMRFDEYVATGFGPDGDLITAELRYLVETENAAPEAAFSPDGKLVAERVLQERDGHVVVWDPETGDEIAQLVPRTATGGGMFVHWPLHWDPEGRMMAVRAVDESVGSWWLVVWEAASGLEVSSIPIPAVGQVAFFDSQTVIVPDPERERVVFYDINTGDEVDQLSTPGHAFWVVDYDPLRQRLVLGGDGEPIQAWDLENREQPRWSQVVGDSVHPWVHSHAGLVAATGFSAKVWLVDIDDGSERGVLLGHQGQVLKVIPSPHGSTLVTTSLDEVLVWDVSAAGPRAVGSIALGSYLYSPVLSPDGTEVAVSTWPANELQRFNLLTGQPVGDPARGDDIVVPVRLSSDWALAGTAVDGEGVVIEFASGETVQQTPTCLFPAAFSSDAGIAVLDGSSLCDPWVEDLVVDLLSGEELFDLGVDGIGSRGAVFNPSGLFVADRYLVVNRREARLEFYDLVEERLLTSLDVWEEGDDLVGSPTFDPTGRYLAAGGHRVWVIDMEQVARGVPAAEALIFDRPADTGAVPHVAINQDGIVATSGFGSLRLWDLDSGDQIIRIPVKTNWPPNAVFTLDGDHLLYIDETHSGNVLRRFPLDPEELIALAESRVTRGFTAEECERYDLDC